MTVAVITAIYDEYDTLKPVLEQSVDVEWVWVTDNPLMQGMKTCTGWSVVYEPRAHLHPNRAAKTPKCLPWLYTGCESSVWIDASYQVTSPTFVEDVLRYADPIAQFNHPWRQCVYDEAAESRLLPKYADQLDVIKEQMWWLDYVRNHPKDFGLWATGVIARHHTPEVIQMGFDWLADIHQYSYQDQLSHPNACLRNGLRPINLPGTHLANEWLAYQGSGRH